MKKKIGQLLIVTLIVGFASLCLVSCKKKNYTFYDEMNVLDKFIADSNITTKPTASGLYYIEKKVGTGAQALYGLRVGVRYKGTFLDGTVFDQNLDAAQPYMFYLGSSGVISGWNEGISYMKNGGEAKLIVPSTLAYYSSGSGSIPAYTTLIFYINLVFVE